MSNGHVSAKLFFGCPGKIVVKKLLPFFFLAAFLGGCVSYDPAVPEGYAGPVVLVKDTAKIYSNSKGDFFYLTIVDGRRIKDSRSSSENNSYAYGPPLIPVILERNIPAKKSIVTIVGRTIDEAPLVIVVFHTVYEVTGEVVFEPEVGKTYLVKGQLGEKYSAVWIEEEISHEIVTERVEIKGSAALGIFEQ